MQLVVGHRFHEHPDAGHAVDDGVMDLHVGGDAPVLETLDQIDAPQRIGAIQVRAVHARHHRQQLADASGLRQRHVHEVMRQIEVGIVFPVEDAQARQRPAIEGRGDRAGFGELGGELRCEIRRRSCRRRE
jgi:hypothetical protein